MSQTFEVHRPLEEAYQRSIEFAIELIDPVTLERVSQGVKVIAEGLRRKPIVNASGMFVWLKEDTDPLREITIDPQLLPYEKAVIRRSNLNLPPASPPLTVIELAPRADYVFAVGTTGIRGSLIETKVGPPVPVRNAVVRLQWLDDDGSTWRDAPSRSATNDNGDFVSFLRLAPVDVPNLDADRALTVRLLANRSGANERHSVDVKIPLGHVTDPSTIGELIFTWDELQP